MHRIGIATLATVMLLGVAAPASAKIVKTKKASEYKELKLTIGSGFEYEGDSEEKTSDFPGLMEYGVTERLTLTVEPDYVVSHSTEFGSTTGFSDMETSAVYEFVSERRTRPSLSAEAMIKWPTATSDSFTTGEIDYSVGGIISKEFVHFEVDSEWLYTFVGDPPDINLDNSSEISVASNVHLTRSMDLELEVVTSSGGGFHGTGTNISKLPKDVGGGGREYESTAGLSQVFRQHLKLEAGMVYKSDGSWQFVSAWEWNFGESD